MNSIITLDRNTIMSVLTLKDVIEGIEQVYKWKAEGLTDTFPLVFHEFDPGIADMDIKSGHIKPAGIYGMKFLSFFLPNIKNNEAPLSATISLFDDKTGYQTAILEGSCITGMRTSAAAAIGAKYLARKESEVLTVIGAGHQCIFQVAALCEVMPNLKKVYIHDPINHENALQKELKIRELIKEELNLELNENVTVKAIESLEEAIKESDIVVTITPSRKALVKREWVKEGTHFSCIGSDMSGKQEIDPIILKDALVYVDDMNQCVNVGEIELAIKEGIIDEAHVVGEIGHAMLDSTKARTNDKQITVFDSTGIAIQDLITAQKAVELAKKQNKGNYITL